MLISLDIHSTVPSLDVPQECGLLFEPQFEGQFVVQLLFSFYQKQASLI